MNQNENPIAGSLQIRALEFLWENGGATIHQVVDHMNAEPGKPKLAYTTVLTVVRNLCRRGMCSQDRGQGKSHVFAAAITRGDYRLNVARWIVAEHFGGDVKALMSSLSALR